jgi:hypothetical protein
VDGVGGSEDHLQIQTSNPLLKEAETISMILGLHQTRATPMIGEVRHQLLDLGLLHLQMNGEVQHQLWDPRQRHRKMIGEIAQQQLSL